MKAFWTILCVAACLVGCGRGDGGNAADSSTDPTKVSTDSPTTGNLPVFSCAASEYPSWSTLFVASQLKIIDGKEGKTGPVEQKWGVDLVIKEVDYDTCINLFANGSVDASCHTNIDAVSPSQGRESVAVMPTSTSVGADVCIAVGVDSIEDLKGKTTRGLERSVAEFAFIVGLEKRGLDPADFPFKNLDPAVAAQSFQQGQEGIESIQVWNPFALQALRTRSGSKVVMSSEEFPEYIIDMVVVGRDVLEKEGGEQFACALIDTIYQVNERLGPALGKEKLTEEQAKEAVTKLTSDQQKVLVALGAKFSRLPAEDMQIVVRQTRFYRDSDEGVSLFSNKTFQEETTPYVSDFCLRRGYVKSKPTVAFGNYKTTSAQLLYDTQFMERVKTEK